MAIRMIEPEILERVEVGDVVEPRSGGPLCNVMEIKQGPNLSTALAVLSFTAEGIPQMWAAPRAVFNKIINDKAKS